MLPKAHLTSYFRMSVSRWMITPSWLLDHYDLFSIVLLCIHATSSTELLLLLGPHHFCPSCAHCCMKCSLGISNFLKENLVFPILLISPISLHWSLRKAFLSLLAILWNSAFRWIYLSFAPLPLLLSFSQLFVRTPQTTILPFWISFSWGWFWSPPAVQCYKPPSIVLQSLCLPDLIPWIYLSPPLYNHMGFHLGHTWMAYCFSLLSSNWAWILQKGVHHLSHSQLLVLFSLMT